MRYGKFFIAVFSLGLAALAVLVSFFETEPEVNIPFSFSLESGQSVETVHCHDAGENGVYVFLPGYGAMEELRLLPDEGTSISIGGEAFGSGASMGSFQPETAYVCTWEKNGRITERSITFFCVKGLPVLYIDVQSGSMEYLHLDKDHKEPGVLRLYDSRGSLLHSGKLETVKGRGNSSWGADKKPYNLTFSQETDLLGLGKAQRWILLGEGFNSNINIRNKIVYEFADLAGLPYSPDSEWVNLYLNGEYAGLYLLCERNEIHENRVDIPQNGSFLVSLEFEYRLQDAGHPYVQTDSGQTLRIHASDVDTRELDDIWQSVENAILAEDGIDPVSGKHWQDLIDLDSWARKYLLEEIFGNGDGGSLSQFFYCDGSDPTGKIYAGPAWDYDMAMGGYWVWYKAYTNYFVMDRTEKEKGYGCPWFQALYRTEVFHDRVTELYETEFLPLMEQLMAEDLDAYIRQGGASLRTDGLRWGYSEEEINGELEYIRFFLRERTDFLTEVWLRDMKYHVVRVDTGRSEPYAYFAIKPGEYLPELPSYEAIHGLGWFRVDNDEPFDVTQPIYEDVQIYVKTESFQIPKIHYVPLAAMVAALGGLIVLNGYRNKKNGRQRNGRADKIPS